MFEATEERQKYALCSMLTVENGQNILKASLSISAFP